MIQSLFQRSKYIAHIGRCLIILGAVIPAQVFSAEPDHLQQKISDAQQRLSETERRVAEQRQQLARELNALEREVRQLQDQTAVARRAADERTLSLSQLENRLESWREQQGYQANLLHRFIQQHTQGNANVSRVPAEQIDAVMDYSREISGFLFPDWQQAEITRTSGQISELPVLSMGPVTWFWDSETEQAGLASYQDDGRLQAEVMLDSSDNDTIAKLRSEPAGEIVFDPTLSRAVARQQQSETLVEHLLKGGLWVAPILFFALFAVCIALLKVIQLWRLPRIRKFAPSILAKAASDKNSPVLEQLKGMQKRLLEVAQSARTARQRDDHLFVQLQDDRHRLERWISAIAITAAVSPLLGLLGTVSGMIETFNMMTLFGSGDPEVVSGGIAQALVTTELGLVVAIPALILNAVLSRKAKGYYNELESFAISLGKADDED